MPVSPMSLQDGIRAVQRAFHETPPSRWPLYVRQAKQHLRTAIDGFDERKYGFAYVVDLLRAAGKEGVLRIERDRQGAIRVFPGANLVPKSVLPVDEPEILDVEEQTDIERVDYSDAGSDDSFLAAAEIVAEPVVDPPIVDAEQVSIEDEEEEDTSGGNVAPAARKSTRKRKSAPRGQKAKSARTTRPGARKSSRGKPGSAERE
jgi:hypothetical protein